MVNPVENYEGLFSDGALRILNCMQLDEDATYFYDMMAGGFVWSDEFPDIRSEKWKIFRQGLVFRYLIALRRQITLEYEGMGIHPLWLQVVQEAPNWPGLIIERRTGRIVKRLKAAERKLAYELDQCDKPLL